MARAEWWTKEKFESLLLEMEREKLQLELDRTANCSASLPSPPAPSTGGGTPPPPAPLSLSPPISVPAVASSVTTLSSASSSSGVSSASSSSGVSLASPSSSGSPARSSATFRNGDMPVLQKFDFDDSDDDNMGEGLPEDFGDLKEPGPEVDPIATTTTMDTSQLGEPDTGAGVGVTDGDDPPPVESQAQPGHDGPFVGNPGLDSSEGARESCSPPGTPEPDHVEDNNGSELNGPEETNENCDVPEAPQPQGQGDHVGNVDESRFDDPSKLTQTQEPGRVEAAEETGSAPEIVVPEAPKGNNVRKVPKRRRKRKYVVLQAFYRPKKGKKVNPRSLARKLKEYLETVNDKFYEIISSDQSVYDKNLNSEILIDDKAMRFYEELKLTNGSKDEEDKLDKLKERLDKKFVKMQRRRLEFAQIHRK